MKSVHPVRWAGWKKSRGPRIPGKKYDL